MVSIKNITTKDPFYSPMRELRNKVLLRPLGVPDYSWEMYDHRSWHFIAVEENKLVGCAILVPAEDNSHTLRLIQMAVDTDQQGKGIGRLLLEYMIEYARDRACSEINCHARQYAVDFYKKLGFEVYGEPFEEVGIPHNHMKLVL